MAIGEQLTTEQIKHIVNNRMQATTGGTASQSMEWVAARTKALEYYFGWKLGNEQEGRSQVVSRDTAEVIDSAIPSLMRTFYAGDDVVRCLPKGADDDDKAEQATEYVNYVLNQRNAGFTFIHDWLKDGLIGRVGFAKVSWQDAKPKSAQVYEGLDPMQADELGAIEVSPNRFEVPAQPSTDGGYVKLETIAPEEIWVSAQARSIEEAPIIAHGRNLSRSDIREMGFDITDDMGTYSDTLTGRIEQLTRDRGYMQPFTEMDKSQDQVLFFEGFTKLDRHGTGIASLYRVVFLGRQCDELLLCEPAEMVNIIAWSPIRMPHRLVGKSLADDLVDIQETKSVALRGALDNLALANNPRRIINTMAKVNIKDLIANEIGGIIRVEGDVSAIQTETLPEAMSQALNVVQYMDSARENRTGIRKFGSSLSGNEIDDAYSQTATGAQMVNESNNDRLELIARTFAECALKPLVKLILYYGSVYEQGDVITRINGEPTQLNPDNFSSDFDVVINVGLGTQDKKTQVAKVDSLLAIMTQVVQMQGGLKGPLITLDGAHEVLKEAIAARGFKNTEEYLANLEQAKQEQEANNNNQPQDPALLEAQAKIQLELKKHEDEIAFKNKQLEIESETARYEIDQKIALEREKIALGMASGGNINSGVRFGGAIG